MTQSIGRTGTAIRNRARSATGHQTEGVLYSFKERGLYLHNVDLQTEVTTGESWSLSFTISNAETGIAPSDPDSCIGNDGRTGYKYMVWADASWVERVRGPDWTSGDTCLTTANVETNDIDYTLQLPAPSTPGTYSVKFSMRLPGSGASSSITWTVTASEPPASPECTVDGDCGSGMVCENNECVEETTNGDGCTTDSECVGQLVCEGGTCVEPSDSTGGGGGGSGFSGSTLAIAGGAGALGVLAVALASGGGGGESDRY